MYYGKLKRGPLGFEVGPMAINTLLWTMEAKEVIVRVEREGRDVVGVNIRVMEASGDRAAFDPDPVQSEALKVAVPEPEKEAVACRQATS